MPASPVSIRANGKCLENHRKRLGDVVGIGLAHTYAGVTCLINDQPEHQLLRIWALHQWLCKDAQIAATPLVRTARPANACKLINPGLAEIAT